MLVGSTIVADIASLAILWTAENPWPMRASALAGSARSPMIPATDADEWDVILLLHGFRVAGRGGVARR